MAIPPENLVYIDECGIDKYLYKEYAYAPCGQKVVTHISGKKYMRINIVAGLCQGKWVAPMEYGGTTDSVLFEFWFANHLFKQIKSGNVIVLDNATFHKKSVLPELARKYGCRVLFLSPYSPNLNPIEKRWVWFKKLLKKILPLHASFRGALVCCF